MQVGENYFHDCVFPDLPAWVMSLSVWCLHSIRKLNNVCWVFFKSLFVDVLLNTPAHTHHNSTIHRHPHVFFLFHTFAFIHTCKYHISVGISSLLFALLLLVRLYTNKQTNRSFVINHKFVACIIFVCTFLCGYKKRCQNWDLCLGYRRSQR